MLLSLSLICKNEEKNLPRLFESIKGLYDEVIIVDTGSIDQTKKIAADFGAKVFNFPWSDDFSAARNFSFSKATCDYICWLDADDILLPEAHNQIKELKKNLNQADVFILKYDYAFDEFNNCITTAPLVRIIIRDPAVKWEYEVHEVLTYPFTFRVITLPIIISHRRSPGDHLGRNIRILTKALKKRPRNSRLLFYYAKELFYTGKWQDTINAFNNYLENPDSHDNQIHAYWLLGQCYMNLKKDEKALTTFISGIKLDPRWAEFYNYIGQIFYNQSKWTEATRWFEIAKNCKVPNSLGFIAPENYHFIPFDRLCKCYAELGKFKEAYEMNEIALSFRPTDQRLLFNRLFLSDMLFPGRKALQPIRLSLGSGGKFTPTFICTDLSPCKGVQETFDLGKIPYETGTVHAIYCEHALEHISLQAAQNAIIEWARVLRYGGDLTLKVPDLTACCQKFVESKEPYLKDWYKSTIYGYQKSLKGEPAENQFHKTSFTKDDIQSLLSLNGFEDIKIKEYGGNDTPSLEARATFKRQIIKIIWMLNVIDENYPTTRIRALNIDRWLNKNGISSEISAGYTKKSVDELFSRLKQKDIVIFFNHGALEVELITRLQRAGISTIYDLNEDVANQEEIINAVSLTTCCSTVLANKYRNCRTITIPDAYEKPENEIVKSENAKLKVYMCAMGGNICLADSLKPIIEKLGMELIRMSEWKEYEVKWELKTWLQELSKADIIICPQRPEQNAKSNNRATQAMSLGKPIIASPLPAYKEVIKNGENGFIAENIEDWEKYLTLLQDKTMREKIGKAAKESVNNYSIDAVGRLWVEVFKELCLENCGNF